MKLYTEEQLLDICKSVAEKVISSSLSDEYIKDLCDYYGHSKIEMDITNHIKEKMDDDNINKIEVVIYKST